MTKSTALLFCLLVLGSYASYAQKTEAKPKVFKYGKVDPKEFDTKVSGPDSAASAIALFDIGKGYFEYGNKGMAFVFECHTRFKIINKNGYDRANFELQLYQHNGVGTTLMSMDGATYNMENGQMVISKIGKDAKFSEKQDRYYTLKKFTLPNVKEGSIIEYKYKIKSDYIFQLRPWFFQRDIPTVFSEYSLSIPEFYRYRSSPGGFVNIHPYNEAVNGGTFYHYYASNVPGLKNENFVTTMDDYKSKISFELSSITVPGQVYQDFSSSWPKAVKSLKEETNFGQFIAKTSYHKTVVSGITKGIENQDTTLLLIFNHVKNNIKWNKDMSYYTSETNPKSIFEKKTGSSADINLCLLGLLKEAKIEAYPVLLSTRSNGAHPGFPVLTAFDNVVVLAKIGERNILLDATDKNHRPGLIAYENLNHQGLMIDFALENAQWIGMDDDSNISRKNYTYSLKLDEENKLTGNGFIASTGYEALKRRAEYLSATNEADFLKSYKSDKPGLNILKYAINNLNSPEENLVESLELSIEDNVEEAGNLAYFTPLLFERTKENPFRLEERKFPVDFAYPQEENYRITVEFPKGYVIDKMPKNEKIILPGERASFTFLSAVEGNRLMLNSKIAIKTSVFSSEEYHELKELFMNVVRKQAEQIVFKKS